MRPINSREELYAELDMLQGNINRICVSDNKTEISSMYQFALARLEEIMKYNMMRVIRSEAQMGE